MPLIDFDAVAKDMCPKPEDFDGAFRSFRRKLKKFLDKYPECFVFGDVRFDECTALYQLQEALVKRRYQIEVNDWMPGMSEFGRIWVDITDTLNGKTITGGWMDGWKDQETGDDVTLDKDLESAFDLIRSKQYPEGYWEHPEDFEVGFRD